MKKIIFFVILALSITKISNAITQFSTEQEIKTAFVSGLAGTEQIVTTITTSNKLLGYRFTDSSAGRFAIYDHDALVSADFNLLTITEDGCIAGGSTGDWFPYPRDITTGVVVTFTNATGILSIYYE